MEYKNVDYIALVREEFAKWGAKDADKVVFCKVKKRITSEKFRSDIDEAFIPDPDLPDLNGKKIIPLSITDYPRVLSSMTANQAGYWAIMKCKQQKWHISDYECCLTNLEMDM
jgi:hypothetical protein